MAGQQRETERKGKLFSVPDSWGKEKANDIGNVYCYLPSGIALISGSKCICVCVSVLVWEGAWGGLQTQSSEPRCFITGEIMGMLVSHDECAVEGYK